MTVLGWGWWRAVAPKFQLCLQIIIEDDPDGLKSVDFHNSEISNGLIYRWVESKSAELSDGQLHIQGSGIGGHFDHFQ